VDYPDVIDLRRQLLPDRGAYHLIGAPLGDLRWLDEVPLDRPGLLIAEGVLHYLSATEVKALLNIPVIQILREPGAPVAGARTANSDAPQEAVEAPRRALVIEDLVLAADHLAAYLRELNTEVVIHPHGRDVVRIARETKPDVILLDILLPDTSGWQVLLQLKTNPHTRDIPVVIVSVVDEPKRGLAAGAAQYLVKPITRQQLHSVILKAIAPVGQANRVLVIRHGEPLERAPGAAEPGSLILVAEDNPVSLGAFSEYLQAKGHQVIPATNGYEAVERAKEFKPALILMDIQMPGMDGLEAIRRLRATPEFANVPIIALTALAMPGDRERCLAAGAHGYLAKPVGLKRLEEAINRALTYPAEDAATSRAER
jgi:CheY-like chemotaxis protein